jgi:hypothetical protein
LSEFRTNTDHAPAVSLWRDYDIEGERILMAEASSELEGPDLEKDWLPWEAYFGD